MASAGVGCSFSEDTPVATSDGEKPIGEVQVGDEVLAYDEQSQASGYYPVTAKFAHLDTDLVILTIDGEEIETTPQHPFFTQEGGWTPAGELWIGAHILRADGNSGELRAIEEKKSKETMFNLTVGEVHTYFIGNNRWLVHNTCWRLNPGGGRIAAQPGETGEELANYAKNLYSLLTREEASRTTIAIGRVGEQNTFPVVNGNAPLGVPEKIGAFRATGSMHAERYLYELFGGNLDAIGISNAKGPCPSCINYFSGQGYWNIFYNDVFKPLP
jgi:Pretoxin HINT domain